MTASVIDVAEYILQKQGPMTSMKLHKLVYYCQAWHLAWDGMPLFDEEIQAWANGPVIPALYELHRGTFEVGPGFFYAALEKKRRESRLMTAPVRRVTLRAALSRVVLAVALVAIFATPAFVTVRLLSRRSLLDMPSK